MTLGVLGRELEFVLTFHCLLLSKLPEFSTSPSNEINDVERSNSTTIPAPSLFNDDTVPDHRVTENGIELTDRGRYQVC